MSPIGRSIARFAVTRQSDGIYGRDTGLTNGRMIQVLEGINAGERVLTRGSLFIDRAASAT
jgi:cobalt-zinc-cadmium efflux system membrane fusion protein